MFSICLPAFKSKFLKECINSILNQSFTDFELIILNDASPEPIKQIIESFSDKRIRYYENDKNEGAENIVNNWNKCLNLAHNEFVMIMGDDDTLQENYLEVFERLIRQNPGRYVYHCRSNIINEKGEITSITPACPIEETVYDNIWHRLEGLRVQFISDFMYHREGFIKSGGFYYLPYAWGSDDISAFVAAAHKGIVHTNELIFNYRSNSLSITSTGQSKIKLEADKLYIEWLKSFLDKPLLNPESITTYTLLKKNIERYHKSKMRVSIAQNGKMNIKRFNQLWKLKKGHNIPMSDFLFTAAYAFIKGKK